MKVDGYQHSRFLAALHIINTHGEWYTHCGADINSMMNENVLVECLRASKMFEDTNGYSYLQLLNARKHLWIEGIPIVIGFSVFIYVNRFDIYCLHI